MGGSCSSRRGSIVIVCKYSQPLGTTREPQRTCGRGDPSTGHIAKSTICDIIPNTRAIYEQNGHVLKLHMTSKQDVSGSKIEADAIVVSREGLLVGSIARDVNVRATIKQIDDTHRTAVRTVHEEPEAALGPAVYFRHLRMSCISPMMVHH